MDRKPPASKKNMKKDTGIKPHNNVRTGYSFSIQRVPFAERMRKEGSFCALSLMVLSLSFAGPYLKSRNLWIDIPCIFRKVTHLPCLACGITRSFISSAHGNFEQAFKQHPLGPLLFFALAGVFVYLLFCLLSGLRLVIKVPPETRRKLFILVLGVAIVAWAGKLLFFRNEC